MNKYSSSNLCKYRDPLARIPLSGFLKVLSNLVNSLGVKNILDIGCGEGFVDKYLISKNKDLIIHGIDINEEAISMAKQVCPDAVFEKGDIFNIDYPDKSFDLILVIEVLEHLVNPEVAIKEAKRLSRKYCIFSVPLEPYFRICNFIRGKNILRLGNPSGHLWNWSRKQFNSLLLNHFDKIKMEIIFPWVIALCES